MRRVCLLSAFFCLSFSLPLSAERGSLGFVFSFSKDKKHVLIKQSEKAVLHPGLLLNTKRRHESGQLAQTGRLRVLALDETENSIYAKIEEEASTEASSLFSEYPMVMIGDAVFLPRLEIKALTHALKEGVFSYSRLFLDPSKAASTYELSAEGKKALGEALEIFKEKRLSKLLIRAFNAEEGDTDLNQQESQQRALSVRQFVCEKLGFLPERVLALGLGEAQLKDSSRVGEHEQENRRIEISPLQED